ncbi:MAG: glutamate 5-kinase [Ilumatobacteraceae bacterium]
MRVVAKIGTSSITDQLGVIDTAVIDAMCDQLAALRTAGHEVVLVSSGAVSAGVSALGLTSRPTDMPTLQAISAAGQSRLMETYNRSLGRHGLVAAQVLLVPHDFVDRRQYLHARQTLVRLMELGCVPIVNENDAIAADELRFGDNDRIATLVAHNVAADLLVLLTDLPGLYTADPRHDAAAELIREVSADDPLLSVAATASGTNRGSGGMASKLSAARMASWAGVRAVIASAGRPNVLVDAVMGQDVGTTFLPSDRNLPARKLWIGFATNVEGILVVDDGARRALLERGTSLLPAGVIDVIGTFDAGDVVEVRDTQGVTVARGMASVDSDVMLEIKGRRTTDLPDDVAHEAVHRDDLMTLV